MPVTGSRAAVDDAIIRKRLKDGSLTVPIGQSPLDQCVRQLVGFRKALLSDADAGADKQAACDAFCGALDRLHFHWHKTRHRLRIDEAETGLYNGLQEEIAQMQTVALKEIAFLKTDLKAAYQTHLHKEEYEV